MDLQKFLESAANVKPSSRQLKWFDLEFYAFIHFGINTFTGREWGSGSDDISIFNPTQLDADQWVDAIVSAGAKGIVLTAKHHDGFCLWPSKYTKYSVKNTPYKNGKGDIVDEVSKACARRNIKFGIYLSPWDRNSKLYGSAAYDDYYVNQLTELLTNYDDIFMIWQDNANGDESQGLPVHNYDFARYNAVIRDLMPDACIFNSNGPDVRWCGNEAGTSFDQSWSVVPSELCYKSELQTNASPLENIGNIEKMNNSENTVGELNNIIYSKGLVFCPSEVDVSIRDGWFFHDNQEPKSLDHLMKIYISSVGNNSCLHLNIPPNKKGLFDSADVKRLKEFGDKIKSDFGKPIDIIVTKTNQYQTGQCEYVVKIKEKRKIKYVVLRENIKDGQSVESFIITTNNRTYGVVFYGRTIGNKKICCVDMETDEFTVIINSCRKPNTNIEIDVY